MKTSDLAYEIAESLSGKGLTVTDLQPAAGAFPMLGACGPGGRGIAVLPIEVSAATSARAEAVAAAAERILNAPACGTDSATCDSARRPVIVSEDRWNTKRELLTERIAAHCGIFSQVFARNCEVRRIDKPEANAFFSANHIYGPASYRYCYGLYVEKQRSADGTPPCETQELRPGTLVAAAGFSNARRWRKGEREIVSHEWIRSASLPGVRVSGGMGKLLQAFINEVHPDDIMSYSDLEWSDGEAYRKLGFVQEGIKPPVTFAIDRLSWERIPESRLCGTVPAERLLWYRNFGSAKYRLKLSEW